LPGRHETLEQLIESLTRDLVREFHDRALPGRVEEVVKRAELAYRDARIQTFIPLLVRRDARRRLREVVEARHQPDVFAPAGVASR